MILIRIRGKFHVYAAQLNLFLLLYQPIINSGLRYFFLHWFKLFFGLHMDYLDLIVFCFTSWFDTY